MVTEWMYYHMKLMSVLVFILFLITTTLRLPVRSRVIFSGKTYYVNTFY